MKYTKLLAGAYLAVAVLTLVAIILLRGHTSLVNDAVWVRGTIVVGSSALMFTFVTRAARGSRSAYRRVRILAAVMVVAIAVIVALPGTVPLWMKIDQVVCGLILAGLLVTVRFRWTGDRPPARL
jgi:hypothetical protein